MKMAVKLKRANPDIKETIAVLKYGIEVILNGLLVVMLSLFVSLFLDNTIETIMAMIAFVLLRQVSGGYHFQKSMWCTVFSVSLFTFIPFVPYHAQWFYIMNIVSVILCLCFAPSRIENHSNIPGKFYPYLKWISVLLVSSTFVIQMSSISLSFFVQSLLLIRWEVKK